MHREIGEEGMTENRKERPKYLGYVKDKEGNITGYIAIWRNKNFAETNSADRGEPNGC